MIMFLSLQFNKARLRKDHRRLITTTQLIKYNVLEAIRTLLCASHLLHIFARPLLSVLPPELRYQWKRRLEAWKYGAGLDYEL